MDIVTSALYLVRKETACSEVACEVAYEVVCEAAPEVAEVSTPYMKMEVWKSAEFVDSALELIKCP